VPRPYGTWRYPWSTVCALVVSLGFLFAAVIGDLKHSLFTVILVALSYLASHVIVPTLGSDGLGEIRPTALDKPDSEQE